MFDFIRRNTTAATERRSNAIHALLLTVALTPLVLFPEPVRQIESTTATVIAVGGGLLLGPAVSIAGDHYRLEGRSEIRTTIGSLAAIVVWTVLVWWLVPSDLVPTTLHFALAFCWGLSLTAVARHVCWPTTLATDVPRE